MQKQNVAEYKIIRTEIESIKNCITKYVGFLFIGAGAVFSAWGGINALSTNADAIKVAIGYSSLAISVIVIFMLFILIYKFISHNRYAGYCLLLSQEVWENDPAIKDLLIWEPCVDILRSAYIKPPESRPEEYKPFDEALGKIKNMRCGSPDFRIEEFRSDYTIRSLGEALIKDKVVAAAEPINTIEELNKLLKLNGLYNKIKLKKKLLSSKVLKKHENSYNCEKTEDNLKRLNRVALEFFYPRTPKSLRGKSGIISDFWFLFKSLFFLHRTGSWEFPLIIVRIFLVVTLACIVFGGYNLLPIMLKQGSSLNNFKSVIAYIFIIAVCLSHLVLWFNIAIQFRSIMDGENTVLKFYRKFKFIREIILPRNFEIHARWIF